MNIAIQGEIGSFSHQAAQLFAADAEILPCVRAGDAFDRLLEGACDAIALPIENTLAGSVVEHYDLLLTTPVHIEREAILAIRHALIGLPGSTLASLERAYSHPVALAQCRRFLAAHPRIEAVSFYDTAGAVKHILERRDPRAGAIAAELAALTYGGAVLQTRIEDDPANYTRFLLLRRGPPGAPVSSGEADAQALKLSLAFELEHRPGTLAHALRLVAEAGGNLTKVETRPIPGRPWHFRFFMDCLLGDPASCERISQALRELSVGFHNLGCYPVPRPQSEPSPF